MTKVMNSEVSCEVSYDRNSETKNDEKQISSIRLNNAMCNVRVEFRVTQVAVYRLVTYPRTS